MGGRVAVGLVVIYFFCFSIFGDNISIKSEHLDIPAQRVTRFNATEIRTFALSHGVYDKDSLCFIPQRRNTCAPWFIIAGAMKTGTTSIYNYLLNHPQVLPISPNTRVADLYPIIGNKEVRFFNDIVYEKVAALHGNDTLQFYYDVFPAITLPNPKKFVTGEASPTYITGKIWHLM